MTEMEYRNNLFSDAWPLISINEAIVIKTKQAFNKFTELNNSHFCKKNPILSDWLEKLLNATVQIRK